MGTHKGVAKLTVIVAFGLVALTAWIGWQFIKPLPGEAAPDLGREHVTDIAGIEYATNPPTSGKHFPIWAKPGVYDRLLSDGYLIHSLEHGYIILSYDCEQPLASRSFIALASAHEEGEVTEDIASRSGTPLMHMSVEVSGGMSWFTPENPPAEEVALPDAFTGENCKTLVQELAKFTPNGQRIIVVPRLGMDTPIVLTAWRRIDKLASLDESRIERFIRSYHNRGPEKTDE